MDPDRQLYRVTAIGPSMVSYGQLVVEAQEHDPADPAQLGMVAVRLLAPHAGLYESLRVGSVLEIAWRADLEGGEGS